MKDPLRVTTATGFWGKLRRLLTRSEWVIWLIGLERSQGQATEPGLILVQIDGLSRTQLQRALDSGRMPFLLSLLDKEHYCLHTFYSGLPSSTPAVQGELHYGEKTVVPAFGFRDHRTGHLVRMFASDITQEVETRMARQAAGLLTGGSSYGNIYGGGADAVYFCATSFGWSEFFQTINPLKIAIVMVLNFWMFARILGLMMIELVLAAFDFVTGVFKGRQFWQELIMIPARVLVVVLMRELVTVAASFDSARGLPIIHVNFLGYDEQAHRRGPGSRYALWTLKAIDRCIRRIWKTAHQGAGKEYDVWVFSDHGQETTTPYQLKHGKSIQQVVAELVDPEPRAAEPGTSVPSRNRLPSRANWLGIGWLVSLLFGEQDHDIQTRSSRVQTVTSGPLGFVYLLDPEVAAKVDHWSRELVHNHDVPMTARKLEGHRAKIQTAEGDFELPGDAVQVFGAEHPFLDEVANDLIQLTHHPDAGDVVLVGWTNRNESTSFVLQNGAHAGPGIEETRAFALLPNDAPIDWKGRNFLRPRQLRQAAMTFLGRLDGGNGFLPARAGDDRIRILTYNVHACVGMDGQLSPERIARVISQSGADIICLQELDVGRHRSGKRDQAHAIAEFLEMNHQFHPAWHVEDEQFGNAILTRHPLHLVKATSLHHHKQDRSRRSALWVEVDVGWGESLQVINAHLSIYPAEQKIQARQLNEEWVQPAKLLGPVVLCGDFNARPHSLTCQALENGLLDVEHVDDRKPRSTYFSPMPMMRVDHIFVSDALEVKSVQVSSSRIAKVASDHLPLIADVQWKFRQE